jgi:lipopolysaccharide export system protein LptA
VDVKSPEKGGGLSEVTARGNVRFAGFGATGTCETLVFQAGSGAVQMTGNVNVKVKDKLGRVESEMSAETITYKLDSCPTGGTIKP